MAQINRAGRGYLPVFMKISHSWLQSLIYLPESPQQISAMLTGLGLEVETMELVEKIKGNLDGLVVGEVITCEKHPDADKLKITTVDIGGPEHLQVVCGAPNVGTGQKVIVATVGATLYPVEGEPFQIKKSKIRGQLSEGMLCAEDEIGLGKGHDGIMVLETKLPNGTPAAQYFNLQPELVYEIGLTPNRIDAASHFGVARDLKALLGRPTVFPKTYELKSESRPSEIAISVETAENCLRYAALSISGVDIKPAPEWIQNHLKSIGLSPINNIVDITNFVLHELGQPMHAFDSAKLVGKRIQVRKARAGEKLTTLDKTERALRDADLVIADGEKPVALAGIFGGLETGVSSATTDILLESAYFEPVTVRKAAQHHGLKTDSSFRFERGTDPNMVLVAMERAAFLILESCENAAITGITDHYPIPVAHKKFEVSWDSINRLIGNELPQETIISILTGLDIQTSRTSAYGHPGFEETLEISVPPYRVDVTREADIVEEILRVYGIDNIEIDEALSTRYISGRESMKPEKMNVRAGQLLADLGFVEMVTNSLTHPGLIREIPEFNPEQNIEIINRLSEDLSVLRQTLLFSGLEILAYNINRRQQNLRMFEIGKVYRKGEDKTEENYRMGLYFTGLLHEPSWETGPVKARFFHIRKVVENLLERLGATQLAWKTECSSFFSYGQSVFLKGQKIGELGFIKPEIAKRKEVKQPVGYADLDWDKIQKLAKGKISVTEISKFPEVKRDLSLVLDKQINFDRIENVIKQSNKNLIKEISVFDIYEGEKIESSQKSYAVSIILQDENQTLTDQVIDKTMQNIMTRLEKETGAIIRK